MKKSIFLLSLVFCLALIFGTATVAWSEDVNLTGTWKMTVGSGTDGGPATFVLTQDGKVLTGTYKGRFGESPVNGSVEGANFKILFKAGGSSSVYKGVVEGGQMAGEATFGGMTTMAFTGVKE